MTRVFIIHGWGGFPEEAWFPWLKEKLDEQGIKVYIPAMPDSEHPQISTWVQYLAQQIDQPDSDTYLVGHSIGVQTILRYLQTIDQPIGGVISVAGFFQLIPGSLDGPEENEIAKPWLSTQLDTIKIKLNAHKITAIFSDNDKFVGLDNIDLFKNNLGAEIIVLRGKGHMGESDKCKLLPEILEALENMINSK